jgi:hypothetical protein
VPGTPLEHVATDRQKFVGGLIEVIAQNPKIGDLCRVHAEIEKPRMENDPRFSEG